MPTYTCGLSNKNSGKKNPKWSRWDQKENSFHSVVHFFFFTLLFCSTTKKKKKAEASEKHLVKADQQRPAGPRGRRLKRLKPSGRKLSLESQRKTRDLPTRAPACSRDSDAAAAAAELQECEDRKMTQKTLKRGEKKQNPKKPILYCWQDFLGSI